MFTKKTAPEATAIDQAIVNAFSKLENCDPSSEEYAKIVEQLTKLTEMKALIKADPLVSADAVLAIVGNLAGIIMILSYEHAHVITSKALGFIIKSKV